MFEKKKDHDRIARLFLHIISDDEGRLFVSKIIESDRRIDKLEREVDKLNAEKVTAEIDLVRKFNISSSDMMNIRFLITAHGIDNLIKKYLKGRKNGRK